FIAPALHESVSRDWIISAFPRRLFGKRSLDDLAARPINHIVVASKIVSVQPSVIINTQVGPYGFECMLGRRLPKNFPLSIHPVQIAEC
ncbi:MAG: hypothetical protein K2X62_09620, partial [Beijerinckiaceae bacterium]|nr:hypothetical protein [Beijerinckiaceae bacterium]